MDTLGQASTTHSFEPVELLDGSLCRIHKCFLVWDQWSGDAPAGLPRTYTSKPMIDWNGIPFYAELVILDMLKRDDWQGVWVDSFHRKFLDCMPDRDAVADLPVDVANEISSIRKVYRRIAEDHRLSRGAFGGCWDVLCWKSNELLFIETKRKSKDRLQKSQRAWLEAALDCGKTARSFRVVEWDFANSLR